MEDDRLIFGYRNYETGDESRNNWLVAAITGGEGWHNNHHHDPTSASVQHRWWEFDLNFYIIKLLEWLGLASHVVPQKHRRPRGKPAASLVQQDNGEGQERLAEARHQRWAHCHVNWTAIWIGSLAAGGHYGAVARAGRLCHRRLDGER